MRAQDCPGLTTHEAGSVLFSLAANVPADQAIVESGVYLGRSLLYLSEGATAGLGAGVWGFDPFDLPRPSKAKYSDPETYRAALENLTGSGVTLGREFSVKAADSWDGPKVGLLYVDSDHRRGPVLQEFAAWAPHLAPDAVVCWDDHHSDFPGVVQAVTQLVEDGKVDDFWMATDRLAVARYCG